MKTRIMLYSIGLLLISFIHVHAATNYCNNELFPIQPLAEWAYSGIWFDLENEGYTLAVKSVLTRSEKSTALLTLTPHALGDVAYPLLLECNASDGIKLVEFNNIVIPFPNGTVLKLTLNEQSGAILPPMEKILSGSTWPFILDFKGSYTTVKGKSITVGVKIEVNSQFGGLLENIEVPAGTFENVIMIQQDVSIKLMLSRMQRPIKVLNSARTWYLAEGVGPVAAEFLNNVSELISYSIQEIENEQ